MAAAEEMVFATQGAKAQEVVARALAAPVSLAADQVREVSPGRSQAGEVWSPQLLPYQSWEGGSARAGKVDGDADGDLLAAGSLGMGVDDEARARLLAMAARQEGVGGSAAVDVPDEQDAPAVSVQREEAGYALVGFDLRALAQAAGVQSGLAVVLPSFVDGVPVVRIAPGAFARRLVRGVGVDVLVVPDTVQRIGAGAFSALPGRHIHLGAGVRAGGAQACDLSGVTPPLERRTYSVSGENEHYQAQDGSLLSADGKMLLFCAPPYEERYSLPDGVEVVGETAFAQGCEPPHVVSAPACLQHVRAKQWDAALWMCPVGCDGARRLRRRGVRVCGPDAIEADGCWFDCRDGAALLVAGPQPPKSASKRFASVAARARAAAASDEGVAVDAKQAAARAEANDCGGLVSGGRLGPVGQGPSAAVLAQPQVVETLALPAQVRGAELTRIAPSALPYAPKTLIIPATVREVGDGNACRGTKRLVLPEGLERVGAHSFCSRTLEGPVALPKSLRSVGEGSFEFSVCRLAWSGVAVHVPADQLLSCFTLDAEPGCDPFDLPRYDEVLRSGKNVPDRLGALLHRLERPVGLDVQMQAAFADEVRAAGREALVRIAREGSLEMVRQLADLGLMEDKRFDAQIELLRQGNRMDCVAFLMERRHRSGAQADETGERDASASLRSKFAL